MDEYRRYLQQRPEELDRMIDAEKENGEAQQDRVQRQFLQVCNQRRIEMQDVELFEPGQIGYYGFSTRKIKCLAVVDLNEPTIGMILSKKGVLIVWIAPFKNPDTPGGGGDGTSSADQARSAMKTFDFKLVDCRAAMTRGEQVPWGVIFAAEKNGNFMFKDAIDIIKEEFQKLALADHVVVANYETNFLEKFELRRSTVFLDGRSDEIEVYLNDRRITRPITRPESSNYFTHVAAAAGNPPPRILANPPIGFINQTSSDFA